MKVAGVDINSPDFWSRFASVACAVVLAACAALVVGLQLEKYLKGYTVYTEHLEPNEQLGYPAVSFCPGYKAAPVSGAAVWSVSPHGWRRRGTPTTRAKDINAPYPQTKEEAWKLWDSITYNLSEVLTTVLVHGDGMEAEHILLSAGSSFEIDQEDSCFSFRRYDTLSGRCFTLTFPCSGERYVRGVDLILDLSEAKELPLYLHYQPRASQVGLNNNYWPLSAQGGGKAAPGIVTDVGLRKTTRLRRSGATEEAFLDCTAEFTSRRLRERAEEDGVDVCWAPMLDSILDAVGLAGNESVGMCRSRQQFLASFNLLSDMLDVFDMTPCEKPRLEPTCDVSGKEFRLPPTEGGLPDGEAQASIYYETTDESVQEEYILMDLGSLLGAVGGTVGALLGWSALGVATWGVGAACGEWKERRKARKTDTAPR